MIQRRIVAWLVAAALACAFIAGTEVGASGQAAPGKVVVYPGLERPGTARVICTFKDGYFFNRAELVGRVVIVSDPLNRELWRSEPVPQLENYAPQNMTCERSSQSGTLLAGIGGFYAGSSGQQPLILSTDYPIRQEITFEQYQQGVR